MLLCDVSDERRATKPVAIRSNGSDKDVSEGRVTLAQFPMTGTTLYPYCIMHGAMNRLTEEIWRCSECFVGCVYVA